MSVFFQRVGLLLFAVILQRSFLDILWPSLEVPALVISVIISLIFLLGFERGLGWALLTLLLFALLGEVGMFPVFAVGVAYGTSFLSRRLVIEHRFQSSLILSIVAAGAAVLYGVLSALVYHGTVGVGSIVGSALETLLVFPLVLIVLRLSEEYIRTSQMSEFRGLRT